MFKVALDWWSCWQRYSVVIWCKQQWKLPKRLWTCCTKSNVSIKVDAASSKNAFVETLDLRASDQSVLSSALQQSSDKSNTGLKPVKSELVYCELLSVNDFKAF